MRRNPDTLVARSPGRREMFRPSLKYDTRLDGYVTGVAEKQLRGAPKYGNDIDWNWGDIARTHALDDYYGVPIP